MKNDNILRCIHLIRGDLRFQLKYGFFFIYTVLTLLYTAALRIMPEGFRISASSAMIYSDPAAMGLFFMGAILLLEKSQKVLNALAVSPVKPGEYIVSKVISLCFTSLCVSLILALAAERTNLPMLLLGTAFSSVIFTLLGIIAAAGVTSLNQFILITVPLEILGFLPPLYHLFFGGPAFLNCYPPNLCMDLIAGRFYTPLEFTVSSCIILVSIVLLYLIALNRVNRMFQNVGGIKL